MKHYPILLSLVATLATASAKANDSNWFIKPTVGSSALSDFPATATDANQSVQRIEVRADSGVSAGIAVGYQYNNNISFELAWEYRTNDSSVVFDGQTAVVGGDYASNVFFANGVYAFDTASAFKPYLGLGFAWVQELDIDLLQAGQERSYSNRGDVGAQAFAGVSVQISERTAIQAEFRVVDISNVELNSEDRASERFSGVNYELTAVQIGLKYRF